MSRVHISGKHPAAGPDAFRQPGRDRSAAGPYLQAMPAGAHAAGHPAASRWPAIPSGSIDSSMMDYGEAFRAKKAGLKMLVNAADVHELLAGGLAVNVKKLKE